MSDKQFIGLDNAAFRGRLRSHQSRPVEYVPKVKPTYSRNMTDSMLAQQPKGWLEDEVVEAPKAVLEAEEAPVAPQQPVAPVESVFAGSLLPEPPGAQKKSGMSMRKKLLPALAITLFLVGLGVSIHTFHTNNQAASTVHAMASENQDAPDESEPDSDAVGSYVVAPDMPRIVRINKINVASRIRRVGVDAQNKLKAPSNIYDVGWYENSNKPGDAGGAALLDAHVSGPTKPGAFKNLGKLVADDIIEVERGDGKKFSYKVVKSQVYEKDQVDMASALVSVVAGKPGLNLMTCTGPLKGDDYQQRLIVYAVQI